LARPGDSVVRRFFGGGDSLVDDDAACFGVWLEDFFAPFLVAFFGLVDADSRGAVLGRFLAELLAVFFVADFLVVFLAVFLVDFLAFAGLFFFAAFAGSFVDARFAVALFVVFFVAIGTPERSTLSESRIVATVSRAPPSTAKASRALEIAGESRSLGSRPSYDSAGVLRARRMPPRSFGPLGVDTRWIRVL
jgi:hypothetical protein